MRCTNMVADSKTQKKLGHNLTVTRAVLLPKTRLQTTTGHYTVKYTLSVRNRSVLPVLWLIEWVELDVVQELYRQSPHNFSNVTGALLKSCDGRILKTA